MTLRETLSAWRANVFLRSVGMLVGATALAQVIVGLALPIVTRLFTPADFNVLAVFTGVLNILSVAACLRFEVAIPIPEHDSDAINILSLAIGFATLVAALVGICVAAFPTVIVESLHQPKLKPFLWLLPLGVLLAGASGALQFWFVRRREFASIARARIGQSSAVAAAQIVCGWLGLAPAGLLFAQVLNGGAAGLSLGYRLVGTDRTLLKSVNVPRMRAMFLAYDRFPKFSTFEALANSAQGYLPIIMIGALVSGPEAGFLSLAMYAMQGPLGLLGTAVGQVYLSRAAEEHRARRLDVFTTSVFGGLLKTGIGPLIFGGIVAPNLFAIVFGEEWRRAGVLATWMTPWFVAQFLSNPLSMALPVTSNQKISLVLQVFSLLVRVAAVQAAFLFRKSMISEAYALSGFVVYLAYLCVVLHVVAAKRRDLWVEVRGSLPIVLAWTAAGIAITITLAAARRFLL